MSLQETYGFDAFCQEFVSQWPQVSLTFRRRDNRLFVATSALGETSVAVSHSDELAGSTVRRAIADLHARLVVRGPLAGAITLQPTRGNEREEEVLTLVKALNEKREELENLECEMEESASRFSDFLNNCGDLTEEGATELALGLVQSRKRFEALENECDRLEARLIELDPDNEIEEELVNSGRL